MMARATQVAPSCFLQAVLRYRGRMHARIRLTMKLLGVVLAAGALGGCKPKCVDAPIEDAIGGHLDPATQDALVRVKSAPGVKMCARVKTGDHAFEPASMVFSGSMPTAWKTIEDSLLTAGWQRTSQTEHPKPDDSLFQVFYEKRGPPEPRGIPTSIFHLQLYSHGSCAFGDVCVRAVETAGGFRAP